MELVIFTGLPGAGKTSFYRERFADTHVLVSKDLFPNARSRDRRQERLIREAFAEDRSVVVDNTNATVDSRATLIALGRACGARITGYVFELDVDDCYQRNAMRLGKARVPDVGFFATLKQMTLPTYAEGFETLYRVRIANGGFEVRPVER